MLDQAGFTNAKIVCSGDLDEFAIAEMKKRGAKIDIWGVGTKLTTGQPDAALGGIYKLAAVRKPGELWRDRIKLSDDPAKTSYPGSLQVRRFHQPDGRFVADAIYEIEHGIPEPCKIADSETEEETEIPAGIDHSDLLVPISRRGELVYRTQPIEASRERAREQLSCAPAGILQLNDPQPYKVGLERSLRDLRSKLIARAKYDSQ